MPDSYDTNYAPFALFAEFSRCRFSWPTRNSSNPLYPPLLYSLICSQRLRNVIEVGLDRGYSTRVLAQAARDVGGHFWGVEIDRTRAHRIQTELDADGYSTTILVADSRDLDAIPGMDRCDFAYLDGDHSPDAVLHELAILRPLMTSQSIVAIHDIRSASREAWAIITQDPAWRWLALAANFGLGLIQPVGDSS